MLSGTMLQFRPTCQIFFSVLDSSSQHSSMSYPELK
uniref:Uncharacterized protein n=1 Tax=Arundo donax TaxID=35708 RepID=A0A0A9BB74_ARUDO